MALVDQIKNDPIPRELAFAPEEYAARVARVQTSMARQGLDLVILSLRPNLGYLTGYDTALASAYAIGLVPAEGPVWIHCAELMAPCALLFSTIEDVQVYRWTDGVEPGTQLARLLKDRGYDGKRIGVEKAYPETFAGGPLDARSFEIYQEELPNAEFTDATTLVLDVRLVKSPAEIEMIRKAGRITALGVTAAIDTIAEGATDNQVIGAAEGAMIAGGGDSPSGNATCLVGRRAGYIPLATFKNHKLAKGDPAYMEIVGCSGRYNAPNMRTAVIGQPSDGLRRLADASLDNVQWLLENIKPGRTADELASECWKRIDAIEGAYFHGAFGYSIGLSFQPCWTEAPMYIARGIEVELQPGMCFHLANCYSMPAQYGAGFSESIAVTETGCEMLSTGVQRELVVR
jgi:Xaa-Pro dipeptidase